MECWVEYSLPIMRSSTSFVSPLDGLLSLDTVVWVQLTQQQKQAACMQTVLKLVVAIMLYVLATIAIAEP